MGATHTRVAASTDGKTISEPVIFDTDPDFEKGIAEFIKAVENLANGQSITALSGSIFGVLSRERDSITQSLNHPDWANKPIKQLLSDHFGVPLILANDMEAIGMGEALFGGGRQKSIVGYITISTGVNGIRIVDQAIDRNALGFEIGYHIIGTDPTGNPLSFEDAAGGNSLQKRYGKQPVEIAKDDDLWPQVIQSVAIGVHNAILFWSPEVIVFGGSMMRDIPLSDLRNRVGQLLKPFPEPPEFRSAELGNKSGLLGALALVKSLS